MLSPQLEELLIQAEKPLSTWSEAARATPVNPTNDDQLYATQNFHAPGDLKAQEDIIWEEEGAESRNSQS